MSSYLRRPSSLICFAALIVCGMVCFLRFGASPILAAEAGESQARIPEIAAELQSPAAAGLLNRSDWLSPGGEAQIRRFIAEKARTGLHVWIYLDQDERISRELLDPLSVKLNLNDRDILIIGSGKHIWAKASALRGEGASSAAIDAAFAAAKSDLLREPASGIISFITAMENQLITRSRIDQAKQAARTIIPLGLLTLLLGGGLYYWKALRFRRDLLRRQTLDLLDILDRTNRSADFIALQEAFEEAKRLPLLKAIARFESLNEEWRTRIE